jgi:hypothetical protein
MAINAITGVAGFDRAKRRSRVLFPIEPSLFGHRNLRSLPTPRVECR